MLSVNIRTKNKSASKGLAIILDTSVMDTVHKESSRYNKTMFPPASKCLNESQ